MKKLFSLLLLWLASSCALHAPYQRPYVDIPETWRLDFNEITTLANIRWWEQLQDPVLDSLMLEALQNNYDLKAAVARVWEFYAQLGVVSSALFPQANGTASASRNEVSFGAISLPLGIPRTFNFYTTLLNMSYEVDVWGRVRSATETALESFLAQADARRTVVLSLVSSVASTYILMLQYDNELQISKETLKLRIESYELAKYRYEEGITSELDVKQAESLVEDALTQVKEFEILVSQQENLLSILVGRNPQAMERGLKLAQLNMPPNVPEGIPSEILEQRPDIQEAEHQLAAANAHVGEARALYFPQISLTGMYGNESFALHNLFTAPARAWQFGISLYQTLFDAGKIYNQVSVAESQKAQAYYHYLFVIQNAFKEVDDALIAHQKFLELIEVQAKRVSVLSDYLELARLQYDNGQTDYLNVMDAQRNLFAAQLSYAEVKGDSFLSLVNLYKALGGGWVLDADSMVCY